MRVYEGEICYNPHSIFTAHDEFSFITMKYACEHATINTHSPHISGEFRSLAHKSSFFVCVSNVVKLLCGWVVCTLLDGEFMCHESDGNVRDCD